MIHKLTCSARKHEKTRKLSLITLGLGLSIVSFASVTHADVINTGFLYVSDYGLSELDRYQYTYDQTTNTITGVTPDGIGNNTSNAYFLGGGSAPVKEGVHGTANDLIIVGGSHGSATTNITRYTLDGTLIGTIPVNFSAYNGGNVGIGNVLVTPDGKYMYAPLESGNAIVKIDLTNGAIVASYAFSGAHDVAIAANGDVYAANYANGSAKIIRLDSNLNFIQNLVTSANDGISGSFRPSGLSIAADGSLYVDNNKQGGPDSVLHYNLSGTGTLTATLVPATSYIGSSTNNALEFTFGNNIGPDGKLYIAALGGGGTGGFSVTSGYKDGIYAFNPTTDLVTQFILGFTEKTGPASSNGLSAPKYLQFDTNFVTAPDAGYTPAPEPGTVTMVAAGIILLARSKRRNRQGCI